MFIDFNTNGLKQGFSTFSRPGATITLTYWLAGRKIINQEILLKLQSQFIKSTTKFLLQTGSHILNFL
jgi:acetyl-CoA carboxylase beta subunit